MGSLAAPKDEKHLRYLRIAVYIVDTPGNINKKMKAVDRALINAAISQSLDGFVVAEYDDVGELQRKYSQGNTLAWGEPPDKIEIKEIS